MKNDNLVLRIENLLWVWQYTNDKNPPDAKLDADLYFFLLNMREVFEAEKNDITVETAFSIKM